MASKHRTKGHENQSNIGAARRFCRLNKKLARSQFDGFIDNAGNRLSNEAMRQVMSRAAKLERIIIATRTDHAGITTVNFGPLRNANV